MDNIKWIFSGIGVAFLPLIISLVRLIIENNKLKKSKLMKIVDVGDIDLLKEQIEKSSEIRIFASRGTTHFHYLNEALKKINISSKKTFIFLLRDDESEKRKTELERAKNDWENYISKYNIDKKLINTIYSEFKPLTESITLRGYIFDDKSAMLGWYINTAKIRHGCEIPFTLYMSDDIDQSIIINFAKETHEFFCSEKKDKEDELERNIVNILKGKY